MHVQTRGTTAKTLLLAAAAVFGAGTAFAADGAPTPPQYTVVGNPFPYAAPQSATSAAPPASDTGSDAYPAADGPREALTVGQEIPPISSEGLMQTANSLPPGYADSQVTFMAGHPPANEGQQAAAPDRSGGHLQASLSGGPARR